MCYFCRSICITKEATCSYALAHNLQLAIDIQCPIEEAKSNYFLFFNNRSFLNFVDGTSFTRHANLSMCSTSRSFISSGSKTPISSKNPVLAAHPASFRKYRSLVRTLHASRHTSWSSSAFLFLLNWCALSFITLLLSGIMVSLWSGVMQEWRIQTFLQILQDNPLSLEAAMRKKLHWRSRSLTQERFK